MNSIKLIFIFLSVLTLSYSSHILGSAELKDTNSNGILDELFVTFNQIQYLPENYQYLIESWPTSNDSTTDILLDQKLNLRSEVQYGQIALIEENNLAISTSVPKDLHLKLIDQSSGEVIDSTLIKDKMAPVLEKLIIIPGPSNSYKDTIISIFSEAIEPFTFSLPFTCSRPGEMYSAKYAFLSFNEDTVIMTCSSGLMHEGDSVRIGTDSIICDLDSNYQSNSYENRYIIAELKSSTPISAYKNIVIKKSILSTSYQTYTISGRKIKSAGSNDKLSKGFYLHNINIKENKNMKVIKEIRH